MERKGVNDIVYEFIFFTIMIGIHSIFEIFMFDLTILMEDGIVMVEDVVDVLDCHKGVCSFLAYLSKDKHD